MVKNQKGFTLVEVIVVAVIVAVLAAVAIPLYNGYIHDSRVNVANNTAGSVASACAATKQQNAANIADLIDTYDGGETITLPGEDGVDNDIMVPMDFEVTITAGNVTCQSTKDTNADSDVYNF